MKRLLIVMGVLGLTLLVVGEGLGQQPHAPQAGAPDRPQPAAPGGMGDMMGGGMPMMGGMCGMMGGMPMPGGGTMPMMGGMMRGGGGGQMDPKTMGRMLQLRGEIMKAVGDVLIKHGKMLDGSGG